jgi:hypothetical protein
MSNITIKIVEVDQSTQTVLVKYASKNSLNPIDDYPAIAFQLTNYDTKTPEEFIEAIRPQITQYVQQRDLSENVDNHVDLSGWNGHSAEVVPHIVEPIQPAVPAIGNQIPPINAPTEVIV